MSWIIYPRATIGQRSDAIATRIAGIKTIPDIIFLATFLLDIFFIKLARRPGFEPRQKVLETLMLPVTSSTHMLYLTVRIYIKW